MHSTQIIRNGGNPVVSVKSRESGAHNRRPPCGLPSNPYYQVRPIRDHPLVVHIIQIISPGAHGVPISHTANGLVDRPHKPMKLRVPERRAGESSGVKSTKTSCCAHRTVSRWRDLTGQQGGGGATARWCCARSWWVETR
ncbi:hypothetical protein JCGZ_03215 [Jatropha curcas]|uniref:Uncharacterized protein n=1 Tax=Jatropha curcas TaxID=180498 RepID=A0A067L9A5_JATCU|nr:hypothetical protein JCGZ_03215 [Jatropha curcas]